MKKYFILLAAIVLSATVWAQSPQKFSYQSVVRDTEGKLVKETKVGMEISILQDSTKTVVYSETQMPTTNANGLLSIQVGSGTTEGDFSSS